MFKRILHIVSIILACAGSLVVGNALAHHSVDIVINVGAATIVVLVTAILMCFGDD